MLPAQQRFKARNGLGAYIHLGLVHKEQFAPVQGHPQFVLHHQLLHDWHVHLLGEQPGLVRTILLGGIECHVRILEQRIRC